jgi:hypothetical protein
MENLKEGYWGDFVVEPNYDIEAACVVIL